MRTEFKRGICLLLAILTVVSLLPMMPTEAAAATKTYKITYNANAGSSKVSNMPGNGTKTHGKTYTISTQKPTRAGYIFDKWSTGKTHVPVVCAGYKPGESYKKNKELTLYAQWDQGYTVKYNANNGTGSMSDSTFLRGNSYSLKNNTFTRNGYVFTGWNTKADGSGTSYSNKASVKNLAEKGGSITLYAQWTNTYTVFYVHNGTDALGQDVSGTMTPSAFLLNQTYNLPANRYARSHTNIWGKKTTYVFMGWNTKQDGTGTPYADKAAVRNLASKPNVTVHLYAQWAASDNVFTVKYDKNGGTGSMDNSIIRRDTSTALRKNTFTRSGYTFEKWTTNKNGTGTAYTDGKSVKNLAAGGGTITLYAKWKSNTGKYTVTYNANGGSGGPGTQTMTHGQALTLSSNVPTRADHTFQGWSANKSASSAEYPKGKSNSYTIDDNLTLYAVWKHNPYTVTFHANSGTGAPAAQTKNHGQALTLSSNVPTRAGYTFLGWAKSKSATKPDYVKGKTHIYSTDADMTLYAVWEKLPTYDMKYHANGTGVTNMPADDQKIKDQKYTVSSVVPKWTGYVFKNWNTKADPAWNDPPIKPGEDYLINQAVNFYAQWEPIEYEIKYDPNGGSYFLVKMLNTNHTYDKSKQLNSNNYWKSGYEFAGWNSKADGSGKSYKDTESVKNLSSTDGASVTLYAQWKKKGETPKETQPAPKPTQPAPKPTQPAQNTTPAPAGSNQTVVIPDVAGSQKSPAIYQPAQTYDDVTAVVEDYWKTIIQGKPIGADKKPLVFWNAHIRSNGGSRLKTMPFINTVTATSCDGTNYSNHGHSNGCGATDPYSCTRKCTSNLFAGVGGVSDGMYFSNTALDAQCSGFAAYMGYVVFQSTNTSDFTLHYGTGPNGLDKTPDNTIHPGDIVRVGRHSFFVYAVNGGTAETIECNVSEPGKTCKIYLGSRQVSSIVSDLKSCDGIKTGLFRNKNLKQSTKFYTIKFSSNKPTGAKNPTGTMADQKACLGGKTTLTANAFKIEGYVFDGWNTKKDGKGTSIKDKGSVADLTTKENETVTLYAQWRSKAADDYIKSCISFTSSLRAEVTVPSNTEYMKSLPCSERTNSASKTIRSLKKDEQLTVTGLLKNPQGNYWYKVKADSDGAEGYVFSKQLKVWSENNIDFQVALEKYQIPQGDKNGCEISGSVKSPKYGVAALTGVLDDSDASTAKQTKTITNGFSAVQNTIVDNELKFSLLKRGKGTLTLTATMKNNYRYDEGKNTHVQASEDKIIDFTVFARYNVKFDKNTTDAVSNMPEAQKKTDGTAITLSSMVPARTNYAFLGWAKDKKATEADFKAGAELNEDTAAGDLVLYAVWKRVDAYEVIYKPNASDVKNMPDNAQKIKGETYTISTKTPTRVGYLFREWSTAENSTLFSGTDYDPGDTYKKDKTLTLYAQWDKGYAVYYDGNGGTGNMEPSTFERGKKVNLSRNTFARDKHVFLGWNTKADGTGINYSDGEEVKNLAEKGGSIKLYAKWTNTYQVAYHYNVSWLEQGQISGKMEPSFFEMGKDYNLAPNPYTRVNKNLITKDISYVFLGWNTKADGTGTFYEDQARVRNLASAPGKLVNLFAQWAEPDTVFTVVYNKNGGTGTMKNSVMELETSMPLRKNTFTRSGYTFEKWTTASNGTGSSYTDGQSVKNIAKGGDTITLHAKWKSNAKVYTIQYVANGGTGTMQNSSHTVGVASKLSPNGFTRPGHVFKGWNTKADGSEEPYGENAEVLNLATTDKAVVKLYAQWQEETEAEYLKKCTLYPSYMNLTVSNGSGKIMALPVAGGIAVRQLTAGEQMVSTGLYKNSKGEYWYQVRANRDGKVGYVFAGDASSRGIADRSVNFGVWLNQNSILRGYACDILGSVSAHHDILYKVTGVLDDSDPKTEAQTQTITSGFADIKGTNLNKKLAFATLNRGKGILSLQAMLRSAYSTDGKTLLWEEYTTEEYPLDFRIIGIYNVLFQENTTDKVANMPNMQNKTDETDLILPASIPIRTGYTFRGWAKDKDAEKPDYMNSDYLREDTDTGNLTFYAVWAGPNEYTVTFDANGGTGGPGKATATHWKEFYYPQKNPTLPGCTFLGWSKTQNVDGNAAGAEDYLLKQPVLFTEDTTLYAVWKHGTVTITYYHNDGSGQTKVENILASKAHTLLGKNWITRDGYILLGYAETADATEPDYLPGEEIIAGTNQILYLVWKPEIWTVTYNSNGGSGAPAAQEKRKNVDLVLSSQIPVRMNDAFLGWSDSADSKDVLYRPGDIYTANADITLYAVWEATMGARKFTVTYNANGGTGGPEPQTKYEGVDLHVSQQWPTREGYYCMGWATTPDATMPTVGGIYTGDEDVTFYAVWRKDSSTDVTYTVTFDANGGTGAPEAQTKIHGQALTLSTTEPTREGYTFQGWATTKTAVEAMYSAGSSYTANAAITLYAVWKEDAVAAYLMDNHGKQGWILDNGTAMKVEDGTVTDLSHVTVTFNLSEKILQRYPDAADWAEDHPVSVTEYNIPVQMQDLTLDFHVADGTYDLVMQSRDSYVAQFTHSITVNGDTSIEIDLYELILNFNGGVLRMGSVEVESLFSYYFYENDSSFACAFMQQPVREGYKLLGWDRDADALAPEYNLNFYEHMFFDRDLELYAVWQNETVDNTIYLVDNNTAPQTFWAIREDEIMQVETADIGRLNHVTVTLNPSAAIRQQYPDLEQLSEFRNGVTVNDDIHMDFVDQKLDFYVSDSELIYAFPSLGIHSFDIREDQELRLDICQVLLNFNGGKWNDGTQGSGMFYHAICGRMRSFSSSRGPVRDGFTHLGWATDLNAAEAEYDSRFSAVFDRDTVLYAVWKEDDNTDITYTVTFDANGGQGGLDEVEVTQGEKLMLWTDVPQRDGYEFLGWAETADAVTPTHWVGNAYAIHADMTLYAVWQRVYTVTYDANGGFGSCEPSHKYKDTPVELPYDMVRDGYEFMGWAETADAETPTYLPGAFYTENADITLYAVWKSAYTIDYASDILVKIQPGFQLKRHGEPLILTGQVSDYDGHVFKGWQADINGECVIFQTGDIFTYDGDVTLRAVWDVIRVYDVHADKYFETGYGGETEVEPFSTEGLCHVTITVEPSDRIRSSYSDIQSWYRDLADEGSDCFHAPLQMVNGKLDFYVSKGMRPVSIGYSSICNVEGIKNSRFRFDEDVSLTVRIHEIMLEDNGGLIEGLGYGTDGICYSYCTNYPAVETAFPTIVKDGYTHVGWSRSSDATVADYEPDCTFSDLVGEDYKLYAVWQKDNLASYMVYFDDNGGGNGPGSAEKIQGEDMALPGNIPEREHYRFLGWAKDPEAQQPDFPVTGAWLYTEDRGATLYAVWEKITHTITYRPTYGTGYPTSQIKYDGEPLLLHTEIPQWEGYTFLGWGVNDDGHGVDYLPGDVFDLDEMVDLYAIWKRSPTRIYDVYADRYWEIDFDTNEVRGVEPFSLDDLHHITITVNLSEAIRQEYVPTEDKPEKDIREWFENNCSSGEIDGVTLEMNNGKADFYIASAAIYQVYIGKINSNLNTYMLDMDDDIQLDVQSVTVWPNGGIFENGELVFSQFESSSHPMYRDYPVFEIPVREGYDFAGWATTPDASEAEYMPESQYEDFDPHVTEIYAVWQKK